MSNRTRCLLIALLFGEILAFASAADAPANASRTEAQSSGTTLPPAAPATIAPAPNLVATDPSYRLIAGDSIYIAVSTQSGQVENSASQTIGHAGDVRLPWIKEEIKLGGKTVREAEHYLENLYKEKRFLKSPVASVKVSAYFLREVSILGAVRSPGSLPFPPDVTSLDIVTVITKVGGFTPAAKQDSVTLTHRTDDGQEKTQTLDLRNVIGGRTKPGRDRAEVLVYPGDRIWVPESLF